jgi:pimeloyl-ACP methyl ester carboxylesterase
VQKTFVLVHGAWHGGWCYARVAQRLRRNGHLVFTPTLTGVADRSHLLNEGINLDTHVLDVANLLQWENLRDVVLCGHSYGGMVITGVADRMADRIGALVYLDAFLPEDGQSLFDLSPPETGKALMAGAMKNDGYKVPPIPAAVFKVNAADCAWVDAQCTPHPLGTMTQKLRLTGAHKKIRNRLYIWASGRESVFRPIHERLQKDPAWRTASVPCGHDVMLDMPDQLTELREAAL